MEAYSNLGLPIIISDAPSYSGEDSSLPTMFLILGTATILVDFQYTCVLKNKGNSNNNTRQIASAIPTNRNDIVKRVTSYTIYAAGSSRALVNKIYSTEGVELKKAFEEAYSELKSIYDDAVSLLDANISNYDVVIWRCDNTTNA